MSKVDGRGSDVCSCNFIFCLRFLRSRVNNPVPTQQESYVTNCVTLPRQFHKTIKSQQKRYS